MRYLKESYNSDTTINMFNQEVKCKDVEQETCANVPILNEAAVEASISWPEPMTRCSDKPLEVTRVSCDTVTIEKCITVPEIVKEQQISQVIKFLHEVLSMLIFPFVGLSPRTVTARL